MELVEDASGDRYALVKRSTDACLVRDLTTGGTTYVPAGSVRTVTATDELAAAVPDAVAAELPTTTAVELVGLLGTAGPQTVRAILDATTLCERDLFALTRMLIAADVLEPATLGDRRGYRLAPEIAASFNRR